MMTNKEHKFTLTELENMLPWEREIYLTMFAQKIEAENNKRKNN